MKRIIFLVLFLGLCNLVAGQTTHQVCISEVNSPGACNSTSGVFTPGNLTIAVGDQIQFTTYMILLGGYNGTHDIHFTGSAANNVLLPISTNILAPVTTVTTPPFMTPGTFPMECVHATHCLYADVFEGWPCTGYSVTVTGAPLCTADAAFTSSLSTVCAGSSVTFTNTSTGAASYSWKINEVQFATTTNTSYLFSSAGTYSLELIAMNGATCKDSVTTFITVQTAALAGADNTASVCNSSGSSIDLDNLLSGNNAVGTWAETTSSGQFNAGTGILNASGLAAGNYTFTYTVSALSPCVADVSNFVITVQQAALAGSDNSVTVCSGAGTTIDLDNLIAGNNGAGTWAETSSSGQVNTGSGVLDASGLANAIYTFTYTVSATSPCAADVANFSVLAAPVADAGADNSAVVCNNSGFTIDMNTLLSGGAGVGAGVWSETTSSGQFIPGTGVFETTGLPSGVYEFTYTIASGAMFCNSDVADFQVIVEPEALAGLDNSTSLCNSAGSTIDLNTLVSGNNGTGTWAETSSSGQFNMSSGVFDASGLAPGNYAFTYTVTAPSPCAADVSNFTVTVTAGPTITVVVTPATVFLGDSVYVDFTTTGVLPGATYTWDFCDGEIATYSTPFYYTYDAPGIICLCGIVDNNNGCVSANNCQNVEVIYASGVGELAGEKILLYPNPSTGNFTIDFGTLSNSVVGVSIIDPSGRVVRSYEVTNESVLVVDRNGIAKGTYLVKVLLANEETEVFSVVLE